MRSGSPKPSWRHSHERVPEHERLRRVCMELLWRHSARIDCQLVECAPRSRSSVAACQTQSADSPGRKRMTPRRRRMMLVALIVLGVGSAVAFGLSAFQNNLTYFYSPTDVAAGKAPSDKAFRVGGMVTKGSFQRPANSLEAHFVLTDYAHDVQVSYTGVLPDLFREGQGIIARGRL